MTITSSKHNTMLNLIDIFKDVLFKESEAIRKAAQKVNDQVIKAINIILESSGRVVISGMGKSGLIGRKISATLSSTGTPSFFLHPAEALHGDLGMVTDKDVMLLISKSGETDELIRLIPYLRRIGAKIISLVGNLDSTIAKLSDVAIDISVEREACPLNLAPTSSTTVTLAFGDALAISLLEAKGFKEKDFARLHPSGSLGRKFLTVSDLMHTGQQIPLASQNTTLKDSIILISKGGFGTLVVVDDDNLLSGIVTDGDLRRIFEKGNFDMQAPVKNYMTKNPKRITPERLAMEALKIMEEKSITSLVVVSPQNDRKVVGFIHLHDILKSRIV